MNRGCLYGWVGSRIAPGSYHPMEHQSHQAIILVAQSCLTLHPPTVVTQAPAPVPPAPCPPLCLPSLAMAFLWEQGLLWMMMSVPAVITRAAEIQWEDNGEKCSPSGFGAVALTSCGTQGWELLCHWECPAQLQVMEDELQSQDNRCPCAGVPFPSLLCLSSFAPAPLRLCHIIMSRAVPLPGSPSWGFTAEAGKGCSGMWVSPQTAPHVQLSWPLPTELSSPSTSPLGR